MRWLRIGACLVVGLCFGLLGACGGGVAAYSEQEAPRPDFPLTVAATGAGPSSIDVTVSGKINGHIVSLIKLKTNCDRSKEVGNVACVDVNSKTRQVVIQVRCGSRWYRKTASCMVV